MNKYYWSLLVLSLFVVYYISCIMFSQLLEISGRGNWMPQKHVRLYNAGILKEEQNVSKTGNATNIKKRQTAAGRTITPMKLKINQSLPSCPDTSPNLIGNDTFCLSVCVKTESKLEEENPLVQQGGSYRPENCRPKYRVAVIIAFRNRESHLLKFLEHMHPIFQRKQMDYKIYIINQIAGGTFNHAKLSNIGFVESLKEGFDCFVFHDVDMILEDDRCPITCSSGPVQLGLYVDKYEYQTKIGTFFMGGSAVFSKEEYLQMNGMSNSYWGWGGEDDDTYYRVMYAKLHVQRYPICRYSMIKHKEDMGNMPSPIIRFEVLRARGRNFIKEGLNNLKYKIVAREEHQLYTNITADVLKPEPLLACISNGECHRNDYYRFWYPQVRENHFVIPVCVLLLLSTILICTYFGSKPLVFTDSKLLYMGQSGRWF